MDFNSYINQKIKEDFVNREIYFMVNRMIEELSNSDDFKDEVEMEFSVEKIDRDTFIDDVKSELKDMTGNEIESVLGFSINDINEIDDFEIDDLIEIGDNLGVYSDNYMELPGIMQYFVVSDWLGEKLEQKGEVVGNLFGMTIWGRQATGSLSCYSYIISEICNDLGLLK